MFKSKAKKIQQMQEEFEMNMERLNNSITTIIDDYQDFEIMNIEEIGKKIDFNYVRAYVYMLCNYAEDILTLVNNKRYPSLYILINNFLECYGLCRKLISDYFTSKETYQKTLKKYYASTLVQRKCECEEYETDFTLYSEDEEKFYDIRFEQMEKIIMEFFEYGKDDFEGENREIAIYDIVGKISEETQIPLNKHNKIIEAISKNNYFTEEERTSLYTLYISAKSASQNNIQTQLTRILGKIEGRPALMLNKNEGLSEKTLNMVEKCLLDVVETIKDGFGF